MLHVANTNNMNQCIKYVGKCFTMCAYNSGTENDHQNNSNYRRLRLLSACAYNAMSQGNMHFTKRCTYTGVWPHDLNNKYSAITPATVAFC